MNVDQNQDGPVGGGGERTCTQRTLGNGIDVKLFKFLVSDGRGGRRGEGEGEMYSKYIWRVPWQGAERANNRMGIRQKMLIVQTIECKTGRKKNLFLRNGPNFYLKLWHRAENFIYKTLSFDSTGRMSIRPKMQNRIGPKKSWCRIVGFDGNGPKGQPTENAIYMLLGHWAEIFRHKSLSFLLTGRKATDQKYKFYLILEQWADEPGIWIWSFDVTGRLGNWPKMQFWYVISSSGRKYFIFFFINGLNGQPTESTIFAHICASDRKHCFRFFLSI